jgi:hypothetical protein
MPESLQKYNKAIGAFVSAAVIILVYFLGPDNDVFNTIVGLCVVFGIPLTVVATPKNKNVPPTP